MQGGRLREIILRCEISQEAHGESPQFVVVGERHDDAIPSSRCSFRRRCLTPRIQLHTVRTSAKFHFWEESVAAVAGNWTCQGKWFQFIYLLKSMQQCQYTQDFEKSNTPIKLNLKNPNQNAVVLGTKKENAHKNRKIFKMWGSCNDLQIRAAFQLAVKCEFININWFFIKNIGLEHLHMKKFVTMFNTLFFNYCTHGVGICQTEDEVNTYDDENFACSSLSKKFRKVCSYLFWVVNINGFFNVKNKYLKAAKKPSNTVTFYSEKYRLLRSKILRNSRIDPVFNHKDKPNYVRCEYKIPTFSTIKLI